MKCHFLHCEKEAGNHNYGSSWNNSCNECLEIYFSYEAHLTGQVVKGFKPEYWEKHYENR